MRLFDFFKSKPKFIDDTFGELKYYTFKDSTKNYYEGMVMFQGCRIGIIIDANENGPTTKQKDFYKQLNSKYQDIKEFIILPFLKKELEDNIEKVNLDEFDKQFQFDGISIDKFEKEEVEWSITYNSLSMKHYVSIDFQDMEPLYMTIDG